MQGFVDDLELEQKPTMIRQTTIGAAARKVILESCERARQRPPRRVSQPMSRNLGHPKKKPNSINQTQ
jgi:hypothetical protein